MIRGNKGIFIAITIMLSCVSSWAALDIFDHPKEIERKRKFEERHEEMDFLDYPKGCFIKGDYKETLESCQKLLGYPRAQALKGEIFYLIGLSLLKLDRFLESRSYFNDILLMQREKEDLKRDALLGIGNSYFLEGNFDKAYNIYNQILTRYPESEITSIVYYRLGETLSKLDRQKEAKYYLDKVQKEFPFSFEARLSNNLINEYNVCKTAMGQPGHYYVQAGCFNEKDNADRLCEKLVKEGFDAYILESDKGDSPRFRVKVGKFYSRDEAEILESKLNKAGYSTKVCP